MIRATLLLPLAAALLAGCSFRPAWDDTRFPPCAGDADCRAGCVCAASHCLPPGPDGSCDPDGCLEPCTDPPPAECLDAFNRRAYLSPGSCVAGDCVYAYADRNCTNGCLDGACLGPPCGTGWCDLNEECIEDACRCGGAGPDCSAPEICCGTACFDARTTAEHCGDCDTDCTSPPPRACEGADIVRTEPGPCVNSACQFDRVVEATCPATCDPATVTCETDPCQGVVCNTDIGEWCQNGVCGCAGTGSPCYPPLVCCGEECVDTSSAGLHCGGCYSACSGPGVSECTDEYTLVITGPTGECQDSACLVTQDTQSCEHGCVIDQCLALCNETVCAYGETCDGYDLCSCGGGPTCPMEWTCCSGTCADLWLDPSNCGACGHVCSLPHATSKCTSSMCFIESCDPGFDDCDQLGTNGCETDLLNDPAFCGECFPGLPCDGEEICVNGLCESAQAICPGDCAGSLSCCLAGDGSSGCLDLNLVACIGVLIGCRPGGCNGNAYCCIPSSLLENPATACSHQSADCAEIVCETSDDCPPGMRCAGISMFSNRLKTCEVPP